MGVENNNAVLATTWNESEVERIKEWIETLPTEWAALLAIVPAIVNFKTTIVMCPDGSKEYWISVILEMIYVNSLLMNS